MVWPKVPKTVHEIPVVDGLQGIGYFLSKEVSAVLCDRVATMGACLEEITRGDEQLEKLLGSVLLEAVQSGFTAGKLQILEGRYKDAI